MFHWGYIFWNLFLAISVESVKYTVDFPTEISDLIGKHIIYDIYKYDRSWYDARVVCRSIGGDLADIVDTEDIDTVKQMNQAAGDFLSTKHYFSSAVRHTTDEYLFISDCKYVNGSLYTVTGDTGSPPDCLEAHHGHFHSVSSCKDDIGDFVCERKSSYKCYCTQDLQTDIVINEATSERECKQSCDQDGACWAAITTSTQCIKAMIPGFGLSSLNISIKSCPKIFEAYVNETIFQLPKDFVIDKPQHDPPTCTASESTSTVLTPTIVAPTPTFSSEIINPSTIMTSTVFVTAFVTSTMCTIVIPTETVSSVEVTSTSTVSTVSSVNLSSSYQPSTLSAPNISDSHVYVEINSINPKETSAYRRSLTSAPDDRKTVAVISVASLTLVFIPLWVIILADVKHIVRHIRNHNSIYTNNMNRA